MNCSDKGRISVSVDPHLPWLSIQRTSREHWVELNIGFEIGEGMEHFYDLLLFACNLITASQPFPLLHTLKLGVRLSSGKFVTRGGDTDLRKRKRGRMVMLYLDFAVGAFVILILPKYSSASINLPSVGIF